MIEGNSTVVAEDLPNGFRFILQEPQQVQVLRRSEIRATPKTKKHSAF
jgi:hypothetical protein